jgi:hypothetical protein
MKHPTKIDPEAMARPDLTTAKLREMAHAAEDEMKFGAATILWREAVRRYPKQVLSSLARVDIRTMLERADGCMITHHREAHRDYRSTTGALVLCPLTGATVMEPLFWAPKVPGAPEFTCRMCGAPVTDSTQIDMARELGVGFCSDDCVRAKYLG